MPDNISCIIKQFSIVAGPLDTDNTLSFPWPFSRVVLELTAYATNGDGTYTPVYPQVSWNYINGQIVVNGIKGLTSTKKYNLTFVVK